MVDPVEQFEHDHGELTKRVLDVSGMLGGATLAAAPGELVRLAAEVDELRDALMTHFAREEEGLFPFVIERLPDLRDAVEELQTGHDAICGALMRLSHSTRTLPGGAELGRLSGPFNRFELAYVGHAKAERELLQAVGKRLDAAGRLELAELVRGL
jgi:hypothetical protein